MSSESQQAGVTQQDRTLSDLLETYRHLQADPTVDEGLKEAAAERMKPVWTKLARLQDPDGFINHISDHVNREYQRRHHASEDPNLTRRTKPLCRCDRPRHVCEVKEGEVPSKIRTQNLTYIQKPESRTLARDYIQEHSGDVVVREAMESFRGLRADIYGELTEITAMMMGKPPEDDDSTQDGEDGGDVASADGGAVDGPQPSEQPDAADASTASADGGVDSVGADEVADDAVTLTEGDADE